MQNIKKYIPNILTSLRIVFVPLIIYLGITNHYLILITLAIIIALTDSLDGILARKWHVVSKLGGNLDAIADKLLAIGLLIVLIVKHHSFFYILLFECLISILNLYFYFKKQVGATLLVGKFKTWIIFITIIFGFVDLVIPSITPFVNIAVYFTVVLQVITLICYIIYWIQNYQKKNSEAEYLEYYKVIEPFLKASEFQKRKDFPHHINESVYDHVLRVSFDCYQIGKKLHLDEESLAIAGLLHDFYEKPWQYSKEKRPILEQHAFTHAQNAVINAKNNFGELITPKIESIMITHMFPINKRIPRNREAWLLTFVDKADSIDFILHPFALLQIFRRQEYETRKSIFLREFKQQIKEEVLKKKTVK